MSHIRTGWRLPLAVFTLIAALALVIANVSLPTIRANPSAPTTVSLAFGDSTALARWSLVAGATGGYRVTLIRVSDLGIMEQKTVPSNQTLFDAQGIWPGQQYEVAVEAIDSAGTVGPATVSAPGQAVPISRAAYNGFLDTENVADGQIDTNLWDVRLGQDNPPNQGGTFVNNQMHYHIEAGDSNGDQTFTSMRARVPFDLSGGRTLTVHGEVDLKGDLFNWFGAILSPRAESGDQLIDLVDRSLETRSVPQLELFDDQNGLHLFEATPTGAFELGTPFTGGYHTNNVRDEIVWKVSTSHVTVLIDGQTAFDANLPQTLPFTSGYLHLVAENYPGNTGGVVTPSSCDGVMGDCNVWHIDNWGFDAASGAQPATAVYYTSQCGPYPSREHATVTFTDCQRLDNTGGFGFLSEAGQTASATFTLPTTFSAASAGLAFDSNGLTDSNRLSVSLNGGAFVPVGYVPSRTNSWQSFRIPLDATRLKAGTNVVTFRDAVAGSYNTPQVANLQLETVSTTAYSAPQLPSEPAPIGTWSGGTPTPTPVPTQPPTPSPSPSPIPLNNTPCTVTLNGVQQTGTCSGTFTPTAKVATPLVGVANSMFEYGCGDGHYQASDYAAMRAWHINTVSIPVSSALWISPPAGCPDYRQRVRTAVLNANAAGIYAVLTLAWVNPYNMLCAPNNNPAGAGYPLPSRRETNAFWPSVASLFADRTGKQLGYQLYSEPHDITPALWRDGGAVTTVAGDSRCAGTYSAAGYQEVVTLMNQDAPGRTLYLSGLGWGGNLSQVVQNPVIGQNILYDVHLWNSSDTTSWQTRFGFLGKRVVALEFGQTSSDTLASCATNDLLPEMQYLAAHTAGMVAWTWDHGHCGRPPLLADFNGTPTSYGQPIHDFFVNFV